LPSTDAKVIIYFPSVKNSMDSAESDQSSFGWSSEKVSLPWSSSFSLIFGAVDLYLIGRCWVVAWAAPPIYVAKEAECSSIPRSFLLHE
jgi:hypothetical protein